MAESVVDLLETVEVEKEDGASGLLANVPPAREALLELRPVGEAGEVIVQGGVLAVEGFGDTALQDDQGTPEAGERERAGVCGGNDGRSEADLDDCWWRSRVQGPTELPHQGREDAQRHRCSHYRGRNDRRKIRLARGRLSQAVLGDRRIGPERHRRAACWWPH